MGVVIGVIVAIIVIALIGFLVWRTMQNRRIEDTRKRFGPEYDRAVEQHGGNEREAAGELSERKAQVEQVTVRQLTPEQRQQYSDDWRSIQAEFVDNPGDAVIRADGMITNAMKNIGYPVDDFSSIENVASVRFPEAADNYRQAHAITEQQQRDGASTEDLRQAMVLYRSLFERLVGMPQGSQAEAAQ